VKVPASRPWTDSGVDVTAESPVTYDAWGQIRDDVNDPQRRFGPGGDLKSGDEQRAFVAGDPCDGAFHAELIGRIGRNGKPFSLGPGGGFVPESSGRLFLGVNDSSYDDNAGSFKVDIESGATASDD